MITGYKYKDKTELWLREFDPKNGEVGKCERVQAICSSTNTIHRDDLTCDGMTDVRGKSTSEAIQREGDGKDLREREDVRRDRTREKIVTDVIVHQPRRGEGGVVERRLWNSSSELILLQKVLFQVWEMFQGDKELAGEEMEVNQVLKLIDGRGEGTSEQILR